MLRIAYGINNGLIDWNKIPHATTIADTFGKENGLSFAFVNISKFSNQGAGSSANWDLINKGHGISNQGRRFERAIQRDFHAIAFQQPLPAEMVKHHILSHESWHILLESRARSRLQPISNRGLPSSGGCSWLTEALMQR